jgi:hypothetical protein
MERGRLVAGEPVDVPEFYVNGAMTSVSAWDFLIDFYLRSPNDTPPGRTVARIRMSPQHALAFALGLQKLVEAYQAQIGPITIPEAMLAEMGLGEGSAADG